MNLDELKKTLDGMLNKEPAGGKKRNIVFWYDEQAEFTGEIDELQLDKAVLIKLTGANCFAVKYRLEKLIPSPIILFIRPSPNPCQGRTGCWIF